MEKTRGAKQSTEKPVEVSKPVVVINRPIESAKDPALLQKQAELAEAFLKVELGRRSNDEIGQDFMPEKLKYIVKLDRKKNKTEEDEKILKDYKKGRLKELIKIIDNYPRKRTLEDGKEVKIFQDINTFRMDAILPVLIMDTNVINAKSELTEQIYKEKMFDGYYIDEMGQVSKEKKGRFIPPNPLSFVDIYLPKIDQLMSNENSFASVMKSSEQTKEAKEENEKFVKEITDKAKKITEGGDIFKNLKSVVATATGQDAETIDKLALFLVPGNAQIFLGVGVIGTQLMDPKGGGQKILDHVKEKGGENKRKFEKEIKEKYTGENLKKLLDGKEPGYMEKMAVSQLIRDIDGTPDWKFYDLDTDSSWEKRSEPLKHIDKSPFHTTKTLLVDSFDTKLKGMQAEIDKYKDPNTSNKDKKNMTQDIKILASEKQLKTIEEEKIKKFAEKNPEYKKLKENEDLKKQKEAEFEIKKREMEEEKKKLDVKLASKDISEEEKKKLEAEKKEHEAKMTDHSEKHKTSITALDTNINKVKNTDKYKKLEKEIQNAQNIEISKIKGDNFLKVGLKKLKSGLGGTIDESEELKAIKEETERKEKADLEKKNKKAKEAEEIEKKAQKIKDEEDKKLKQEEERKLKLAKLGEDKQKEIEKTKLATIEHAETIKNTDKNIKELEEDRKKYLGLTSDAAKKKIEEIETNIINEKEKQSQAEKNKKIEEEKMKIHEEEIKKIEIKVEEPIKTEEKKEEKVEELKKEKETEEKKEELIKTDTVLKENEIASKINNLPTPATKEEIDKQRKELLDLQNQYQKIITRGAPWKKNIEKKRGSPDIKSLIASKLQQLNMLETAISAKDIGKGVLMTGVGMGKDMVVSKGTEVLGKKIDTLLNVKEKIETKIDVPIVETKVDIPITETKVEEGKTEVPKEGEKKEESSTLAKVGTNIGTTVLETGKGIVTTKVTDVGGKLIEKAGEKIGGKVVETVGEKAIEGGTGVVSKVVTGAVGTVGTAGVAGAVTGTTALLGGGGGATTTAVVGATAVGGGGAILGLSPVILIIGLILIVVLAIIIDFTIWIGFGLWGLLLIRKNNPNVRGPLRNYMLLYGFSSGFLYVIYSWFKYGFKDSFKDLWKKDSEKK